mgnify:CR=1 FL=1
MSVKTEIKTIENSKAYPKLRISRDNYIVLFSNPQQGTVISIEEESGIDKIGDHSTNWDPEYFRDFKGSITLTNE